MILKRPVRNRTIFVRVTGEEKARIEASAQKDGATSLSDWARRKLLVTPERETDTYPLRTLSKPKK